MNAIQMNEETAAVRRLDEVLDEITRVARSGDVSLVTLESALEIIEYARRTLERRRDSLRERFVETTSCKRFMVGRRMESVTGMELTLVMTVDGPDGSSELWTQDGGTVIRSRWCECGCGDDDRVYYLERCSGAHGWACARCRCVVQTG